VRGGGILGYRSTIVLALVADKDVSFFFFTVSQCRANAEALGER
jgi:hypothetical protein